MKEKQYFPKITASSVEDFQKIEVALKTLPQSILNQIEVATSGMVGIDCTIRPDFQNKRNIQLPSSTRQIENFDDYIGCYSDGFFFRIPIVKTDLQYSYLFVTNEGLVK